MALRDLFVFLVVFGLLPFVFSRPWLGVLLWTWIGIMNPHRMAWGYAVNFPFALVIAVVTLPAVMLSKEKKVFPIVPEIVLLLLFIVWMTLTTPFALYPDQAWITWVKVVKIQLFIFITLIVMHDRRRIDLLLWVSTLSLAFFGVKGGIYTILQGGGGMVLGPAGGFIESNTTIALALVMAIPLMRYLQIISARRWIRWALGVSMILSVVAVLGTYSRGAFLAVAAMGFFLWLKSRQKFATALLLLALVPAVLAFMPEGWHQRMGSIQNYEQDNSAMTRINAWGFDFNQALDRPLNGGGFEAFQPDAFTRWAPYGDLHWQDAHSIWFEVLGEHGFVGLGLYLLMWFFCWRTASSTARLTEDKPDLKWAHDLGKLIQVALVGFWVGGSFLGLAYWDYPYILLVVLVLTQRLVRIELSNVEVGQQVKPGSEIKGVPVQVITQQR
jgi:putative inorganic carbon (HCO3(-)) transporter